MHSDSTITDELLVQQTVEISDADDEEAHTSIDTVESADEDESAERSASQQISDETVQKTHLTWIRLGIQVILNILIQFVAQPENGDNQFGLDLVSSTGVSQSSPPLLIGRRK